MAADAAWTADMRLWRPRLPSWLTQSSRALPVVFAQDGPLDLRILGRAVLQAVAVGVACGLIGALFLALLDRTQHLLLESLAGYIPLRAQGEARLAVGAAPLFRPWILVVLPALGGLGCGLVTLRAPEARGGGGNPMIRAFHQGGGIIQARLIPLKMLASILTLGSGGAGGREGPTMLVGGAVGSLVGQLLPVGVRERRILMLAGVAAGISAVFRTPLGAALLAVEVLYRDGFESDALIPAVLASVVSYSVVISIHGQTTLFGHAGAFPFVPAHLPLYALLALMVSLLALAFLFTMGLVRRTVGRLPIPRWTHPALGGLTLGVLITPVLMLAGPRIGTEGQGLGMLGGGYGAVQLAISGAAWLPGGWPAVVLLAGLAVTKVVASSLTIGSGGSAGDFAPSLAMGGLLGGAFGCAARLLLADPRIDPGAFALVGMGAFYGGVAHVPLSALVLVCEMAGNYDLLVPLMLALGISSVILRNHSLYEAQVPTQHHSPVYSEARAEAPAPPPPAEEMVPQPPAPTTLPAAAAEKRV
jgi:CIC family chloride channel protein